MHSMNCIKMQSRHWDRMKKIRVTIIMLLIGILFLSYGIYTKDYEEVLDKAQMICFECIGIG